jgi:ribosome-associated toxin RatA of RatAB toxin-antitoxin module
MPRHEEQATLAYGADELFAVVADVKDYPLFVPWCSGARIHRGWARRPLDAPPARVRSPRMSAR